MCGVNMRIRLNKYDDRPTREKLIVETMKFIGRDCTVNEVIDYLWNNSTESDKIGLGWRYFVHLNKFTTRLVKIGLIKATGETVIGNTKKKEKLWRLR